MSLYGIFHLLYFAFGGTTLSTISVSVGLMFPLCFEFVLWYTRKAKKGWGPCSDNCKLFDQRWFISAWEPQLSNEVLLLIFE